MFNYAVMAFIAFILGTIYGVIITVRDRDEEEF